MDVVLRESSSDAPAESGADSDEAEDDLRSVPPSSGESELSTVIVNPDLGKIWRYLRGPDLGLCTKMSESDWYSPKGSESLESATRHGKPCLRPKWFQNLEPVDQTHLRGYS
jgi:hypothetical protein